MTNDSASQLTPIDTYLATVADHLKLRGAARAASLDDLRATLTELAADTTAEEAIASLGPAEAYAASLDAEFATASPWAKILGVPNSFGPGIARRVSGTFDPADPRLIVPRVFGGGWTLNAGALAARFGVLNPDDADDEITAAAVARSGAWARAIGALPGVIGIAVGVRNLTRQRAGWAEEAGPLALGLASAGLAALSASTALEPRERLALPGAAATLGGMTLGGALSSATRRGSSGLLLGWLGGAALSFALKVVPLRLAITERLHEPLTKE